MTSTIEKCSFLNYSNYNRDHVLIHPNEVENVFEHYDREEKPNQKIDFNFNATGMGCLALTESLEIQHPVRIDRRSKLLRAYQCVKEFRNDRPEEALIEFKKLSDKTQMSIFKCLQRICSSSNEQLNPTFTRLKFGIVPLSGSDPRCMSTNEERAQAIELYIQETVARKLEREIKDAAEQQKIERSSLQFSEAPTTKDYPSIFFRNKLTTGMVYSFSGFPCITKGIDALEQDIELITKQGMGTTLQHLQNRTIGIAHMQGSRPTMEDEHLVTEITFVSGTTSHEAEIYGIFDGHAGRGAAIFVRRNLALHLKDALEKYNPTHLSDEGIFAAIEEAFINLDEAYTGNAGTTVTAAIILNDQIWTANLGDSRTVLCNEHERRAIQLTEDQMCTNIKHLKGITKRGGTIVNRAGFRVNNILTVPRAIGDHSIVGEKGENCILHSPIVTRYDLQNLAASGFLILACDGLWDMASSLQTAAFIARNMIVTSLDQIALEVITKAYNAGSTDNISAMIVRMH